MDQQILKVSLFPTLVLVIDLCETNFVFVKLLLFLSFSPCFANHVQWLPVMLTAQKASIDQESLAPYYFLRASLLLNIL